MKGRPDMTWTSSSRTPSPTELRHQTTVEANRPPRLGGLLWRLTRRTTRLAMPLAGKRWNPIFAVVEHHGRRSGRVYSTPVAARRTPEGFIVSLAFGAQVDWHRNLQAAGGGRIRWRGQVYPVGAPLPMTAREAIDAFNVIQRLALRAARIDGFIQLPDSSTGSA